MTDKFEIEFVFRSPLTKEFNEMLDKQTEHDRNLILASIGTYHNNFGNFLARISEGLLEGVEDSPFHKFALQILTNYYINYLRPIILALLERKPNKEVRQFLINTLQLIREIEKEYIKC